MKIQKTLTIAAFLLVFMMICPSAYGQDEVSGSDEWEFMIAPYLWAIGLDGEQTVKGNTSDIDMSFGDILDMANFAAQFRFEAKKGKWGLFIDPLYASLSADADIGPLDVDVDIDMAIVELGGFYRFHEWASVDDQYKSIAFDLLGGVRYTYMGVDMEIKGGGPLGADIDIDEDVDWLDPFIGLRCQVGLTEKLSLNLRGDIGGFDIGDASDVAWKLVAMVGYQLKPNTTLYVGYGALDMDYDDGSGADLFEYDVNTSGPVIGVAFQF